MITTLNAPQPCADYFRTYLRTRLHHWRDHAAVKTVEITTLDAEQEHILKAITLGLDLEEAWSVVRDLIIAFAPYMERRGHWEAWHVVLQHAIAAAQRVSDTGGEITLTALLAKLCQRQSRTQDVVRYYRRAIRLAQRTGNRYELARACSNLGYLYTDKGHWWRAEILNQHAGDLYPTGECARLRSHPQPFGGALHPSTAMAGSRDASATGPCPLAPVG
ncbi:MAG: tetratricopeptide repeat protein [Caldilineaceae bacterium]